MNRYARQNLVPQFGVGAQDRLRTAHVLVVGAGGLAVPVLQYLTGAGVGRISIVDPDVVEESNLHRQTLFVHADIGRLKASVAAQKMRQLNPEVDFVEHICALDPGNVAAQVQDVDLVLDCADSVGVSYTLSDHCLTANIAMISASVVGLSGYCGGFCHVAPSLRAVFPDPPNQMANCATDGVLGPVVGVVGGLQAQMAIAALVGLTPSPLGQIVSFDSTQYRFGSFRFDTAPEPEIGFPFVAAEMLHSTDFIIDLRATHEASLAHPTAVRIQVADIAAGGQMPRDDQRVVLCCQTGLRAWQAAEKLTQVWPGQIVLAALGIKSFN